LPPIWCFLFFSSVYLPKQQGVRSPQFLLVHNLFPLQHSPPYPSPLVVSLPLLHGPYYLHNIYPVPLAFSLRLVRFRSMNFFEDPVSSSLAYCIPRSSLRYPLTVFNLRGLPFFPSYGCLDSMDPVLGKTRLIVSALAFSRAHLFF